MGETYLKDNLAPGSRFIDLAKDYNEVKLLQIAKANKTDEELSVIQFNHPDPPTFELLETYSGIIFPDLFDTRNALDDYYCNLKKVRSALNTEFKALLYNGNIHRVSIEVAIEFYMSKGSISKSESEGLIKLDLAKGIIDFESLSNGKFIRLAKIFQDNEDKKRFLQGIADEIVSKSQRIELLVKHGVSKGNYREMLLRNILQKYIPKKYEIATGFIEGCNRQCDIIIYDAHNFCPFFQEGDLVVVPEKAVRAIIEVKTTLTSTTLKESLELLSEISRNRNFPAPIFKAIFAFNKGLKTEINIANVITNYYNNIDTKNGSDNKIYYLYEAINAVCVLNEQCLISDVIDYELIDLSIHPRIYKVVSNHEDLKVYCATFFNELFSYLDVEKHAKKININYFRELDSNTRYCLIKELYDNKWIPQFRFQKEHHTDLISLWKRVTAVLNWKAGRLSVQDLEELYFAENYQPENYVEKISSTNFKPSSLNIKGSRRIQSEKG